MVYCYPIQSAKNLLSLESFHPKPRPFTACICRLMILGGKTKHEKAQAHRLSAQIKKKKCYTIEKSEIYRLL